MLALAAVGEWGFLEWESRSTYGERTEAQSGPRGLDHPITHNGRGGRGLGLRPGKATLRVRWPPQAPPRETWRSDCSGCSEYRDRHEDIERSHGESNFKGWWGNKQPENSLDQLLD